jgi:hypothetical protein
MKTVKILTFPLAFCALTASLSPALAIGDGEWAFVARDNGRMVEEVAVSTQPSGSNKDLLTSCRGQNLYGNKYHRQYVANWSNQGFTVGVERKQGGQYTLMCR